jgi:hypothetical protein
MLDGMAWYEARKYRVRSVPEDRERNRKRAKEKKKKKKKS